MFRAGGPSCVRAPKLRFSRFSRAIRGLLSTGSHTSKRSAATPEPMFSGRRNHGDPLIAKRRVQIKPPNSLKKLLLQKPFLHPYERGVIILHRNHHGGLADDPMPEAFWHSPQPYTHPADDHQQKPAGSELVPAAQHAFQNLKHIHFLTGTRPELFVE